LDIRDVTRHGDIMLAAMVYLNILTSGICWYIVSLCRSL